MDETTQVTLSLSMSSASETASGCHLVNQDSLVPSEHPRFVCIEVMEVWIGKLPLQVCRLGVLADYVTINFQEIADR